jgi:hypothetical protein
VVDVTTRRRAPHAFLDVWNPIALARQPETETEYDGYGGRAGSFLRAGDMATADAASIARAFGLALTAAPVLRFSSRSEPRAPPVDRRERSGELSPWMT